jgi:YHS domain-containing protein
MTATHPEYVITRTDLGADVNYHCPCGCYAGFALDRSLAEQDPESCCCGRTILVGRDAPQRLRAFLPDAENYALDEQTVEMPWGQPFEVALATPPDAEHGAHGEPDGVAVATAHDPVCHMDINPATAAGSAEHGGATYYFCSRGCLLDFTDDPVGTLAAEAAYDHSQGHQM